MQIRTALFCLGGIFIFSNLEARELSVLSFNMQHRDRPEELSVVAEHLKSDFVRQPDFILCQEALFQRSNGAENTAKALGDFLGYETRGTKRPSDREGVAIISAYPFEFYDSIEFDAQTSPLLLGFRRIAVMGEFQIPEIGLVRVVTTHLTNWEFEGHIRKKQVTEMLQWMSARNQAMPADLIVLGGDFNAKPTWSEMQLIKDIQLTAGAIFKDFNNPQDFTMSASNPSKRIDYIFVSAPRLKIDFLEEKVVWKGGLTRANSTQKFFPTDHLLPYQRFNVSSD